MKAALAIISSLLLAACSDVKPDTSFVWGLDGTGPSLTITKNDSQDSFVWNDSSCVGVMWFSLCARGDIEVKSITFNASGSGIDNADVLSASLHIDENGDGVFQPGIDTTVGTDVYSADDGTITFSSLSLVISQTTIEMLLTYDFSGGAQQGASFNVSMSPNDVALEYGRVGGNSFIGNMVTIRHGTWSAIADNVGTYAHRAVWADSDMIVWGGYGLTGYMQSIGIYNPQSNTWQPYSDINAPTAMSKPGMAWTGGKLVIWGGWDLNPNQDGGVYDRGMDLWQPITTIGAPTARAQHALVWTGSSIIVWGGLGAAAIGDGASYTISSDVWQPLSSVGAPSARYKHPSIWAEEAGVMIIWGGLITTLTPTNTGAMYYPTSGAWVDISLLGAPTARSDFCSVWTGTEFIVWGGNDGVSYLQDGHRFSPFTNSWTSMASSGAPSPRALAEAVWTGSKMIIWGGEDENGQFNDGAIYVPSEDKWQPISLDGTPAKRERFTAVWTGSGMIVFGGRNDVTGTLMTGAIFSLD